MLCAVIIGPSFLDAQRQIEDASLHANLYEFRLDLFQFDLISEMQQLLLLASLPVIFTLRATSQGGSYVGSETDRLATMQKLAQLSPAYLDIEYTVDVSFFDFLNATYPNIQLICSYHNYEHTPLNLLQLFTKLRKNPAHLIKIATMAHSTLDALRMLKFVREASATHRIIGLCMGESGQITRTLGKIYGNLFSYAPIDSNLTSAPGQLSIDSLVNTYHYPQLNAETTVLGLIGGTTQHSLSHQTHNFLIRQLELNAIYVKMDIQVHELAEFLVLAQALNFHGLSVTMPLKEEIVPFITELTPCVTKIGALNTLITTTHGYRGSNSDGIGAVAALKNKTALNAKKVVIMGAGGTAKAITCELLNEGASVLLLNRTLARAEAAANILGCTYGALNELSKQNNYDILINCTPLGRSEEDSQLPINPDWITPGILAMDVISASKETSFLKEAKKRNCTFICGKEMFKFQAIQQFYEWFEIANSPEEMEEFFNHGLYRHEIIPSGHA